MQHGGDLTQAIADFGGAPETWLDLSTGINPRPWPIPALPDATWQRLPSEMNMRALRDAARAAYDVPDNVAIVAAPGTQALVQWLPRLAASGAMAILGPTYCEHEAAWRSAGHETILFTTVDALPAHARHVVIVNPNNPDGRIVDRTTLADIAHTLKARGGWLVIDEAFADAAPDCSAIALCRDLPVVVLRSFGKFYGLAGLRLGFALGPNDIIRRCTEALGPWVCSGPAIAIGTGALRDDAWAARTRSELREMAQKLDTALTDAGFAIRGGTSLYRLARHPEAQALHATLARHRIWCRRFDWADYLLRFGLPPDGAGLDRLKAALRKGA